MKELDAFGKQTLLVFNKIDAAPNTDLVAAYRERFPGSVAISARTGEGVGALVQALQQEVTRVEFEFAFSRSADRVGFDCGDSSCRSRARAAL